LRAGSSIASAPGARSAPTGAPPSPTVTTGRFGDILLLKIKKYKEIIILRPAEFLTWLELV
jgi:hypothetical protein